MLMASVGICLFVGCASRQTATLTLMPPPVIYQDSAIDPFAHLSAEQKTTETQIFFATNRTPESSTDEVIYGNRPDSILHLGRAIIAMGDADADWDDLREYSLNGSEMDPLSVRLESIEELATMPESGHPSGHELDPGLQIFVDRINAELASAVDKEIMVFIHGAKANFADAAILTAEIDHFAGRDFVGVAYAWPSHQSILNYLVGTDVKRALNSSHGLDHFIRLLAEHTSAQHINILAYSAGGKVTTKALFELRNAFPELGFKELKAKFRIGSIVLAAIDVDVDVFFERAPAISELAEQVVITITDDDNALKSAKTVMGGEARVGSSEAEAVERAFIDSHHLENIEIVDVSIGSELRGFDIVGHHYWYRHPWMSSDIVFLMRTNLPPDRRGLSPTEDKGIWQLSAEYPDRIRKAAETELEGQW